MGNRTRAQRRASKALSNRNNEVMRFVSNQLSVFDSNTPRLEDGRRNFVARDAFMKDAIEMGHTRVFPPPRSITAR